MTEFNDTITAFEREREGTPPGEPMTIQPELADALHQLALSADRAGIPMPPYHGDPALTTHDEPVGGRKRADDSGDQLAPPVPVMLTPPWIRHLEAKGHWDYGDPIDEKILNALKHALGETT